MTAPEVESANHYQYLTGKTEIYTEATNAFMGQQIGISETWLKVSYCTGKLNGEAGEIAEKVFKAFRGNVGAFDEDFRLDMKKELGDVMWYVARLAALFGWNLDEVMQANIDKLFDRKDRGVLHGHGDNR